MLRYTILFIVSLASVAVADPVLERENNFFGIPGLDSLSNQWIIQAVDTADISARTDRGFDHPVDVEILRLSPVDYRLVILDAVRRLFTEFRIDRQNGLSSDSLYRSPISTDSWNSAAAMCQVKAGEYFDPEIDRIAVAFKVGGMIGIYQFDPAAHSFAQVRTFTNLAIAKPMGIFWAFDNFFIVDEATQSVFRTDSLGNIRSSYGGFGGTRRLYRWISDISGYITANVAHLYVSDGLNGRVDHLTSTAGDPAILFHSQALAITHDSTISPLHECMLVPGVGVVGFDRSNQRVFTWGNSDSLQNAYRDSGQLPPPLDSAATPTIHLRQAGGRLVFITLSNRGRYFTLRSYRVNEAIFDNPSPLPFGHWTQGMSPVTVRDSLHIESGDSLTIDAGVHVLFEQSTALVVDSGAKLIVCGTETDSVRFSAKDAGETWNGIYVNRGQLDISYATLHDCYQNAIHTDYAKGSNVPVSIRNCYINGSKARPTWALMLQLFNSPALKHQVTNCVIDSVAGGNGMYLYNCNVEFSGVTIRNCVNVNSYIKKVTGSFHSCVFEGRTLDYGVLLNSATCNPTFKCCSFLNLAPVTGYFATVFSATGCSPTFGNGLPVLPNIFADTSTHLLAFQGEGLLPIIFKRGNNFYQRNAGGKFVEWQEFPLNPTPFYIENQYWEPTVGISYFTPSMPAYWRYTTTKTSPYGPCDGGISMTDPGPVAGRDRALDEDSLALDTLDYAIQLEVDEDFAAAQAIYLHLVRTTEDWQVRWQAATRIVTTEVHLDNGGQWLEYVIDSLMAAENYSYEASVHGQRLLANYQLNHEEYQPAIDICVDLLESGLLFHDSIAVAMELVGIQMAAGVQEGGGGGLDEDRWARIPDGLKIKSFTHGMEVEKKLLHLLGSGGYQTPEAREIVPSAFRLYQNHPNPFNPTTEIRFDLPEATRVELKVFNTIGQEVTTLADDIRPAGAYRLLWDGMNAAGIPVASGVYIYHLKAAHFASARKMLLVR